MKNSTKPCGKIGKTLRRWKRKYLEDSDDEVDDQDCDIFDIDTQNDNHTTNSSDYTGRNGPDIKFSQVDDDDGVPVIDDAEFLESTIDDCSNEDDDNEVTIAVSNASNGNDNDVKEGMKSNAEAVNSIVNGRDTNKNAAVSRKPKHATTQKVGVEKAKQNTSPPKAKFKKAESMAESQKVVKPRRGRQPGVQKSSNTKTQSKKKFKTQLTPSRTLPYRSRTKPDRLIAGDNKKKGNESKRGCLPRKSSKPLHNKITHDGWECLEVGDADPSLGLEFLSPAGWWSYVPRFYKESFDDYDEERVVEYNPRNRIPYEFEWSLSDDSVPARIVDGKIDFRMNDIPFLPKHTAISGRIPAEMLAEFTKLNTFISKNWLRNIFSGIGGFDDQTRNYAKYHIFGEVGNATWMDEDPFDEDFGEKVKELICQCHAAIEKLIGFRPTFNHQVGVLVTLKARPQRAHCDFKELDKISNEKLLPWIVVIPLTEEGTTINIWPGPCVYVEEHDTFKNNMKHIPRHPVRLVIPFGSMLMIRSDIVHGGSFGSRGNTRMHLAINMRASIEATQNLDCVFSPTGARLHYFRAYLECYESFRIPNEPSYSDDQIALFDGKQKTPIIRKMRQPRGRFAESNDAKTNDHGVSVKDSNLLDVISDDDFDEDENKWKDVNGK